MADFPTTVPSITNPASSDTLAAVPHHTQHEHANDNLAAIGTKIGTGSSTPTTGKVLAGTGAGTSGWSGAVLVGTDVTGALDPLAPPYQITPIGVTVGTAGVYSSTGSGNNFHLASHVKSTGSRPTVAVFGEGDGAGTDAAVWGGNFVAYANHASAGAAIGVEINHGVLVNGTGESYGVVIASAGDYAARAHIQMQANTVASSPDYGILFHTKAGPTQPATVALIGVAASTAVPIGIDLSSGTYSTAAIKTGGGIQFPATQVVSTNRYTLDDYDEYEWTPVLTFGVAGDLSVTYSNQQGRYIKVGRLVFIDCAIVTSGFTYTTSTDDLRITGLPFAVESALDHAGTLYMSGWTKSGYTQLSAQLSASTQYARVHATGSGQALAVLTTADVPSGGTVSIRMVAIYAAAA